MSGLAYKGAGMEFFGELPSDRLISGFLTINVVKHPDNTKSWKGDVPEEPEGSGGRMRPTNICANRDASAANDDLFQEDCRIGDYSCHLFWVVVGCHRDDNLDRIATCPWMPHYNDPDVPWVSGNGSTTNDINEPYLADGETPNPNFNHFWNIQHNGVTGYEWDYDANDGDGGWDSTPIEPDPRYNGLRVREHPDHPHCQSFIRAHPVALINPDTGTLMNHQVFTVDNNEGIIKSKLGTPMNGGSSVHTGGNPSIVGGNTNTQQNSFMDAWRFSSVMSQFGVHNGLGSPYKQPTGTAYMEGVLENGEPEADYEATIPGHNPHPLAPLDENAPNEHGIPYGTENPHTGPYCGFPDLAFNRTAWGTRGNNTGLLPNWGNGYKSVNIVDPPSNSYTPTEQGNDHWHYEDFKDDNTVADNIPNNSENHPNQNDVVGVTDGEGPDTNMDNMIDINRTYKNPVREILIEGWHDFDYEDVITDGVDYFFDGGQSGEDVLPSVSGWAHNGGNFNVTKHTPFALRILLMLNNDKQEQQNDASYGGALGPGDPYEETNQLGQRDIEVNIAFQPVGETNEIIFKHEAPTGTEDNA